MNGWARIIAGMAFTATLAGAGGLIALGQTKTQVAENRKDIASQQVVIERIDQKLQDISVMAATNQILLRTIQKAVEKSPNHE